MLAQIGEIEDLVNMAQEVMGGNVGIEVERVEQTRFAAALASHHPGLAVERSHPSIAAGALCSRCFSTESGRSRSLVAIRAAIQNCGNEPHQSTQMMDAK